MRYPSILYRYNSQFVPAFGIIQNLNSLYQWIAFLFLGTYLVLQPQHAWTQQNPPFNILQEDQGEYSKPLHEVASIGAATTGPLLEGMAGATHKEHRHRFYCHSSGPKPGFLGPQSVAKPSLVKDQPGVFPAPLMGPASLTFIFACRDPNAAITPVIVRPDGTAFHGLPMTAQDSPQTLVVSAPAQRGIYTLFTLAHHDSKPNMETTVDVTTSTLPQQIKTFTIQPFISTDPHSEPFSAEFFYTPSF